MKAKTIDNLFVAFIITVLIIAGIGAILSKASKANVDPPGGFGQFWWVNTGEGISMVRFENSEVICMITGGGHAMECRWKPREQ